MKKRCTLENELVKKTLDELHSDSKGDWKLMLKYTPTILLGLLQGKSMMKSVTPSMLKDAYMPVSKEEGRFLYSLALSNKAKNIVEFGSSFGLGTIYLAAAAKENGGHVITSEIEANKCKVTKENLSKASLDKYVTILEGDALKTLKEVDEEIDFIFLDGWKDLYIDVLDLLLPKLKHGSIVIGDNINLADAKPYLARVLAPDSGFVTTIVNKVTAVSCYVGKEDIKTIYRN